MEIEYDTEIEEWVVTFPDHPEIGERYGDTRSQAQEAAYEALRVWGDADRKEAMRNRWVPLATGVYEVKGGAA